MSDFIPLTHLLCHGRAAETIVAESRAGALTFAAFAQRVAQWQAAFAAQAGQRFALFFEDSAEFATALWGAWQAGKCVYLPADNLPATRMQLAKEVDGFVGNFGDPGGLQPLDAAPLPAWQPLDAARTDLVIYTSGTTGTPCAIPKRLAQLFNEVATLERAFAARLPAARVVATVSHQHIYGLLFKVLWPLAAGRPFLAQRLAFPETLAAALAEAPSVLIASPAHLKRLPPQLPWSTARHSLIAVFSSGGPLAETAWSDCQTLLGQAPIEIFGSSETGGMAWRQRQHANDAGWQALPGIELDLSGDTLRLRSPHLANDDWFTTADRVQPCAGGFVVSGRADRLVKIEEKRVSLTAIETRLQQSPWVADARVLPLPGPRAQLGVVVQPSPAGWDYLAQHGRRALNHGLQRELAEHLEACVLPRRWRHVWHLPANSQGKTTHQALEDLFDPRRPPVRRITLEGARAQLTLETPAQLPYFDGHFPGHPVLPGVTQIEWAIRFARELYSLPANFVGMEALKFQHIVPPDTLLTLELEFKAEKSALTFAYRSAAGQHASGRILLGEPT